jgi:hypothetical protein
MFEHGVRRSIVALQQTLKDHAKKLIAQLNDHAATKLGAIFDARSSLQQQYMDMCKVLK